MRPLTMSGLCTAICNATAAPIEMPPTIMGRKAMRLYEGHNVGGERANGEQIGVAGFGSAMATCFDGYSTEARVARKASIVCRGVAA